MYVGGWAPPPLRRCWLPKSARGSRVSTARCAYITGFLHLSLLRFGVPSRYGEACRNHVGTARSWLPPPSLLRFGVPNRYGEASRNHVGTVLRFGIPSRYGEASGNHVGTARRAAFHLSLLHFGVPTRYGEVSRNHVGMWWFPPPLTCCALASQVGTEKSPETRSVRCAGLVSSTFPCCALASQVDTEKPPETMSVRCAGAGFPHRTLASQVGTEKPPETMSVRCAFQIGLRYGAGFLHHLSLLRCGVPSRYGEGSRNHVGTVRRAGFLHLSLLNFGVLSPCGEVPRNHVGTVCCSDWAAVRGGLPPPRFGVPSRYGEASRNHVGTLGCGTGLWLPPPLLAALWHPKSEKPPETMSVRCAVQILLRYGVGFCFPSRYGEVSRSYMSAQVLCLNVAKHDFSARAAKEPTRSWPG